MKSRQWCFTLFYALNPFEEDDEDIPVIEINEDFYSAFPGFDFECVSCWVVQLERSPKTNRLHIQGYAMMKYAVSDTWMKSTLLEGFYKPHIEPAKGTKAQNYKYCTKADTRVSEPKEFGEFGSEQGKRNDLADVCEQIVGKKRSISEVALEHPTQFVKYHKGLEKLSNIANDKIRDGKYETWSLAKWYHGPTLAGKSERVWQLHGLDKVYVKDPLTKWWDGFDPQKHTAILIDDYPRYPPKEGITFNFLLRLCQPYPCQVEVKGGHVALGRQMIYITSNFDPNTIFGHEPNFEALKRRLYVKFFDVKIKPEPEWPDVQTPHQNVLFYDLADDHTDQDDGSAEAQAPFWP